MNSKEKYIGSKLPLLVCMALLLVAAVVLYPLLSAVDTYESQFDVLDNKRNTVLLLTASSSAASAVITLIPEDVGTPIAEQLANLSTGFTLILIILLAEKYLLPVLGGISTACILPLAFVVLLIYYFKYDLKVLRAIALKLIILAIAFSTIIPASIFLTSTIDSTFEASINGVIDKAIESEKQLDVEEEEDKNIWQKITGAVTGALDYVGKALDIAKNILGNFVDAIAVMLVTCCIIPVLVVFIYLKVIKYVFNLNFSIADSSKKVIIYQRQHRLKRHKNQLT